jgi:uncharacterized protein YqjF (DUF2071 family)
MSHLTKRILETGLPHRPWSYPNRPWAIRQDWVQLSFLHWSLEPETLSSLLPSGLNLDTFEGKAYLGLVPFVMDNVRPRYLPCVPGFSRFPEFNIRTYVHYDGIPGVLFFSLDAANRIAVWLGRRGFNMPYFFAKMSVETQGEKTRYASTRRHCPDGERAFVGTVTTSGERYFAQPGSLEHWLTERYCFYGEHPKGGFVRCDVAHAPWPLQKGVAEIENNSLIESFGVQTAKNPEWVHTSTGVQVLGWRPEWIANP